VSKYLARKSKSFHPVGILSSHVSSCYATLEHRVFADCVSSCCLALFPNLSHCLFFVLCCSPPASPWSFLSALSLVGGYNWKPVCLWQRYPSSLYFWSSPWSFLSTLSLVGGYNWKPVCLWQRYPSSLYFWSISNSTVWFALPLVSLVDISTFLQLRTQARRY